ncbi:18454_t:CDS:2, partial [Racocetra fulgida]
NQIPISADFDKEIQSPILREILQIYIKLALYDPIEKSLEFTTSKYYELKSDVYIRKLNVYEYLQYVKERVNFERDHISAYLHPRTKDSLMKHVESKLIKRHAKLIWEKNFELERRVATRLLNAMEPEFSNNLDVMLNDIIISKQISETHDNCTSNAPLLHVNVLTQDSWPKYLTSSTLNVKLAPNLEQAKTAFERVYKADPENKNKKLKWQYELDRCVVEMTFEPISLLLKDPPNDDIENTNRFCINESLDTTIGIDNNIITLEDLEVAKRVRIVMLYL